MLVQLIALLITMFLGVMRKPPMPETPALEPDQHHENRADLIGYEMPWDAPDGLPDQTKPVYRDPVLELKSCVVLGKAGSGKSHYFISSLMNDIHRGKNVIQIDGTGDAHTIVLNELACAYSSHSLKGRLFIVDLGDESVATAVNILAGSGSSTSRGTFAYNVVDQRLPLPVQVADTLRNVFPALAEAGATICDVNRFLQDDSFRHAVIEQCRTKFPEIVSWAYRYGNLSIEMRTAWQMAVANKVSPFTADPLRLMFGQPQPFPYREIFDDPAGGKIVLINLAADRYYDASFLAGSLFVSDILAAFLSRGDLPEGPEHRIPCRLYVDEAHRILANSPAFDRILTESRRFGLSAVIGTQTIKQIEYMFDIVIGTVSTAVAMQMSSKDGSVFARNTNTDTSVETVRKVLTRQNVGEAVLIRNGYETTRVKLAHREYARATPAAVQAIRDVGQRVLGRPAADVAREMAERHHQAVTEMPGVEILRQERRKGRFKPASYREEASDAD